MILLVLYHFLYFVQGYIRIYEIRSVSGRVFPTSVLSSSPSLRQSNRLAFIHSFARLVS